jgi:hypothetical protein
MAPRLLEVSIAALEPMRWKWCVLHGANENAAGFESTRETAQRKGDAALFQLLTTPPAESYRGASWGGLATSCVNRTKTRNGQ